MKFEDFDYEGYMRAASNLADLVLSARLGVSMHPYPPERVDIPKVDWDAIRAQAEKVRNGVIFKERFIP